MRAESSPGPPEGKAGVDGTQTLPEFHVQDGVSVVVEVVDVVDILNRLWVSPAEATL